MLPHLVQLAVEDCDDPPTVLCRGWSDSSFPSLRQLTVGLRKLPSAGVSITPSFRKLHSLTARHSQITVLPLTQLLTPFPSLTSLTLIKILPNQQASPVELEQPPLDPSIRALYGQDSPCPTLERVAVTSTISRRSLQACRLEGNAEGWYETFLHG